MLLLVPHTTAITAAAAAAATPTTTTSTSPTYCYSNTTPTPTPTPPLPPLLACVGMSTFCPVNSHLIPDEQAKKRLTVGRSGYQLLARATTAQAITLRRLWRLLFPLGQHVPPASQPSSYKYQPCNVWEVMMTLPSNFLLRLQRCTHESGDEQDSDPGCRQIAKLISMRM